MKKIVLVLVIILSSIPVFASFGYSYAANGYSSNIGYGGLGLSISYQIDNTPISIEAGFSLGLSTPREFGFQNAYSLIKLNPYKFKNNPFSFLFLNKVNYIPGIYAGYDYYYKAVNPHSFVVGLAPLCFEDVSYRYDYLSPYININLDGKIEGWGIYLFKVSYFI